MTNHVLTPTAQHDLVEIIEYIAAENPNAAVRVRDEFQLAFMNLGDNPGMGHYREDLLDQRHKFWNVYSYVIVYRWQVKPIQILSVIHGARDLARQFHRRGLG
jgi:antitoxin ParD1/3/4/toxin ParE1/3/4